MPSINNNFVLQTINTALETTPRWVSITMVALGGLAILTGATGLFTQEIENLHRFRFISEGLAISLIPCGLIAALWGTWALNIKKEIQPISSIKMKPSPLSPLVNMRVPMALTPHMRDNPYAQMTIGIDKKENIDAIVDEIGEAEITALLEAVDKGDITSLFENPKLLYVALAALKKHKDKINPFQVGTLALFDATISLFNDSAELERLTEMPPKTKPHLLAFDHEETRRLLELTKQPLPTKAFTCKPTEDPLIYNRVSLTESQYSEFLILVSQLPESEKFILQIPYAFFKHEDQSKVPMNEVLSTRVSFNPLLFYFDGEAQRLVPSLGIMEAYLVAKYGEKAPLAIPRFGITKPMQIAKDLLDNGRVLGILHQKIKTHGYRSMADQAITIGVDFTLHDFYHLFRATNVPKEYRCLLAKLFLCLKRGFSNTIDMDDSWSSDDDHLAFWHLMSEYEETAYNSKSCVEAETLFATLWDLPEAHTLNIFAYFERSSRLFNGIYFDKIQAAYLKKKSSVSSTTGLTRGLK